MKRIGLFLLAVVMGAGLAGCGGGGDDFTPTIANMAGIYNITKTTGTQNGNTVEIGTSRISGVTTLSSTGAFTSEVVIDGKHTKWTGTYAILNSTIVFSGGSTAEITDDGRKFTISETSSGIAVVFYYSRS